MKDEITQKRIKEFYEWLELFAKGNVLNEDYLLSAWLSSARNEEREIHNLRWEKSLLEDKIKKLEETIEINNEQADSKITELVSNNEVLNKEIKELNDWIKNSKKENELLKENLNEATRQIKNADSVVTVVTTIKKALETEIETLKNANHILQDADTKYKLLLKDNKELVYEVNKLHQKLKSLEKDNRVFISNEEEYWNLVEENKNIKKRLIFANDTIAQLKEEISTLKNTVTINVPKTRTPSQTFKMILECNNTKNEIKEKRERRLIINTQPISGDQYRKILQIIPNIKDEFIQRKHYDEYYFADDFKIELTMDIINTLTDAGFDLEVTPKVLYLY